MVISALEETDWNGECLGAGGSSAWQGLFEKLRLEGGRSQPTQRGAGAGLTEGAAGGKASVHTASCTPTCGRNWVKRERCKMRLERKAGARLWRAC